MEKLSKDYIDLEVVPKFKKYFLKKNLKFSYANVAVEMGGLAKSTISKMINDYLISENYLDRAIKVFGIQDFMSWNRNHNLYARIIDYMESNYWVSYRFNAHRNLYVSSWRFKGVDGGLSSWKIAPKGLDFRGPLELDEHFFLSGTMATAGIVLRYSTNIPILNNAGPEEFQDEDSNLDTFYEFDWLVFDVLVKHGNQTYSTIEVLQRQETNPERMRHDKKFICERSNERIEYKPNAKYYPSNGDYLAYNFLTHYSVKSRVSINDGLNPIDALLGYRHTIRVACPVTTILDNEKEFKRILKAAKEVKEMLITHFNFEPENIYFELAEYNTMDEVKLHADYIFESKKTINYTHFLALLPKNINAASGVFTEIFYRIGRKLPIVVCYEDEVSMPGVLASLKNNNQLINTKFLPYKLEEVATEISKKPQQLFSFELL